MLWEDMNKTGMWYRRILRLWRATCAVCGRKHRTFAAAAACWAAAKRKASRASDKTFLKEAR